MAYRVNTDVTIHTTERNIADTMRMWGVPDSAWQIDYNVQRHRLENKTLTQSERAVTLRWTPRGQTTQVVLPMDTQRDVASNLRVLYLAVEAMRLNEKRGIDVATMRAAYMQLSPAADHWDTLGLERGAPRADVDRRYRQLAQDLHPDKGGTDAQMAALNVARDAALREAS